MTQGKSIIQNIIILLFGYKYYANIANTRGTDRVELCSYIFRTREEAEQHRLTLEGTATFRFIETVSFRSRKGWYRRAKNPLETLR